MKIENIISLCSPCSSKYHALDHFKTLKLKEKIVVSSVTILVGILSLPFFSLLAVLTFRGLVKKFSAFDLAEDNANALKKTVVKVKQAKKDPIDLLNFNQEKEVPPNAEKSDDQKADKVQEEKKNDLIENPELKSKTVAQANNDPFDHLKINQKKEFPPKAEKSDAQKADKIQEEKNEPIENPELKSKIVVEAKNDPIDQLKFNQEEFPPKAENVANQKVDNMQEEKKKELVKNYELKGTLDFLERQNAAPIFFAVARNDINEVKNLINAETANIRDKDGSLPFHWAAYKGYLEIVDLFIPFMQNINILGKNGLTALNLAVKARKKEVVDFLLKNNARKDIPDRDGSFPLHHAADLGYLEIVQLLILNGDDVEVKNRHEETALRVAVNSGKKEVVKFLLENKARKDIPDRTGNLLFHHAAQDGYLEIVELLMGDEVDVKGCQGRTALSMASSSGRKEIVDFLLKNKARQDIPDMRGNLPLHDAADHGHLEIVKLLMPENINIKNKKGETALDLAKKTGRKAVVDFLIQQQP